MPGLAFTNRNASDMLGLGVLTSGAEAFIDPNSGDRIFSVEDTVTLAQLNAGKTIVADAAGRTLKVVSILMVFTGGFTTSTDIRISDTNSSPVDVVTVAIAGATNGARIGDTSTTNVTFGAGFNANLTADKGIQVRKTGGTAAAGTSILVRVLYKIIA